MYSLDFNKGAEEQYLDMLRNILSHGVSKKDRTGTGTLDIGSYTLRIDLSKGFPLLTTKKMFTRGIFAELLWFLSGDTNNKTLQDQNVRIWNAWSTAEQCARFGRKENELGPIYSKQWRNFGAKPVFDNGPVVPNKQETGYPKPVGYAQGTGTDQIANALDMLRNNPWSRRIIVNSWDPRKATQVALPPCHTMFQFLVQPDENDPNLSSKLDCTLYQRSSDSFLGNPFNIASYALLTHIMAELSGLTPGIFTHNIGSAHIYQNHLEQVKEQLSREHYPLPSLKIHTFTRWDHGGPGLAIGWGRKSPTTWSIDEFLEYCQGPSDFEISNYQHHPKIKAEVSV